MTTNANMKIKPTDSLTNQDAAMLIAVNIELEGIMKRYNLKKGLLFAELIDGYIEIKTTDQEKTARQIIDECFAKDKQTLEDTRSNEEVIPNNRKDRRRLKRRGVT